MSEGNISVTIPRNMPATKSKPNKHGGQMSGVTNSSTTATSTGSGNASVSVPTGGATGSAGGNTNHAANGAREAVEKRTLRRRNRPQDWFLWLTVIRKPTWGMVLLIVTSLSHMVTGGLPLASVVFLRHLPLEFNGTSSFQTVWVVSVSWGFGWLLSPLIAAMGVKYGSRSLCLLGGFIATLGALFNSFAEHLVHVILSFSMILSFGCAMCHVASEAMISHYYARHAGRIYKVYEGSKYLGMAIFAVAMDAAITQYGWMHGLQMTSLFVGLNFLFGLVYAVIVRRSNTYRGHAKDSQDKTPTLFEILNSPVLRDRLLFLYFGVEVLLHSAMRAPLLVAVINGEDNYPEDVDMIHLLILISLTAFVGNFMWDLPRKCVPTSTLFFVQEQMLLFVTITAFITMATDTKTMLIVFGFFGLIFGGLNAFMTSQVRHLIIKEHRQQAESWSLCARGIGMIFGTPLIVWLNGLSAPFRVGYVVSAGVVMLSVCALYVIMRRLRVREIDIAYIEQSTNMAFRAHRLHSIDRPCQKHCVNGTLVEGVEEPEYEIHEIVEPDLLWRSGMMANVDPGCGMHLVGDYYDVEGEQSPEMTRRKTLAEPSLPILPEVPSQENSSVSRLDCSIHSGGRRESELEALVVVSSDDGGSSNACFSTLDECPSSGLSSKLSPAPSTSAVMAQTQAWVRKSSLPEKSPTLPKFRRFSVDPEIMKNSMYIVIPKSNRSSMESVSGGFHSVSVQGSRDAIIPNSTNCNSTPTTASPSPGLYMTSSSPSSKAATPMGPCTVVGSAGFSPGLMSSQLEAGPRAAGSTPALIVSCSTPSPTALHRGLGAAPSRPALVDVPYSPLPSLRSAHSNPGSLADLSSPDEPNPDHSSGKRRPSTSLTEPNLTCPSIIRNSHHSGTVPLAPGPTAHPMLADVERTVHGKEDLSGLLAAGQEDQEAFSVLAETSV